MAPDINSLPPSKSATQQTNNSTSSMQSATIPRRQDSSSPRGSMSLAAAASMNAADHNRTSSHSERLSVDRRRSQFTNTLQLNDPTIPSPGELGSPEHRTSIGHSFSAASPPLLGGRGTISTGDPHHQRQPSLGDIHNELEQEQEAQVNRMLQMIRQQQQQLDTVQRSTSERSRQGSQSNTAIVDVPTPGSERSFSFQQRPRSISRNPSSANRSPALRAMPSHDAQHALYSGSEWIPPPSPLDASARRNSIRDESAYYQAETANLTRENQMLKHRIRELEKQLVESSGINGTSPLLPSNLATQPSRED